MAVSVQLNMVRDAQHYVTHKGVCGACITPIRLPAINRLVQAWWLMTGARLSDYGEHGRGVGNSWRPCGGNVRGWCASSFINLHG
jgi:hypothetical protein